MGKKKEGREGGRKVVDAGGKELILIFAAFLPNI